MVHVSRAASIASFWNYQAEVAERIAGNEWRFTGDVVPQALNKPIALDAELAADWVHQRDGLSRELFSRLAFSSPSIRYIHLYYEHLHFGNDDVDRNAVAERHWNSLFAFLGVNTTLSIEEERRAKKQQNGLRTITKTHGSIPCQDRIANWDEVKMALKGSLSIVACERYFLSVVTQLCARQIIA